MHCSLHDWFNFGNTATVDYVSGTTITVKLTGCTLPEISSGEDSVTKMGLPQSVVNTMITNTYIGLIQVHKLKH